MLTRAILAVPPDEVVAPLQNKMGALLTDPTVRRILVDAREPLDLPAIMDEGKVLLVNLDKGQIGEGPSATLGSFLVSHLALAAVRRSAVLGIATQTLAKLRWSGDLPPFYKVGRRVLYERNDLECWLMLKRRRSTSDSVPDSA